MLETWRADLSARLAAAEKRFRTAERIAPIANTAVALGGLLGVVGATRTLFVAMWNHVVSDEELLIIILGVFLVLQAVVQSYNPARTALAANAESKACARSLRQIEAVLQHDDKAVRAHLAANLEKKLAQQWSV